MESPIMTGRERHSFLIIFRFNKGDEQNPLLCGVIDQTDKFVRMAQAQASLVVGIVDPSMRSATMPMTIISLTGRRMRKYNNILEHVEQLNAMYRDKSGFVASPASFTQERKDYVFDKIRNIGVEIYALFDAEPSNVVHDWLKELFLQYDDDSEMAGGPLHHVTIVTNDFSIPWYWLSEERHGRFLCEIASVGMLELGSYSDIVQQVPFPAWRKKVLEQNMYQALLINGSPELPFAREELGAVTRGLAKDLPSTDARTPVVNTRDVGSVSELKTAHEDFKPKGRRIEEFRIVHFFGHYSNDQLNGVDLDDYLDNFIPRSLVVLDGCRGSDGLKAWTDLYPVTSSLIRQGAAGCLVSVLPVKNDPIIGEVFWEVFYAELRTNGVSAGEALRRARCALKTRTKEVGLNNPAWLMYQLIGNPSVDAFADPSDRTEAL